MTEPQVLEYAQEPATAAALVRRHFAALLVIVLGAMAGAVAGHGLTPVRWTAEGWCILRVTPGSLGEPDGTSQGVEREIRSRITALQSTAAFDAVLRDLQAKGHGVPPDAGGRAWLARGFRARGMPESETIRISFSAETAKVASDALDAFLAFDALTPALRGFDMQYAPSTAVPHRSPVGPVAGGLMGTGLAAALIAARRLARVERRV